VNFATKQYSAGDRALTYFFTRARTWGGSRRAPGV